MSTKNAVDTVFALCNIDPATTKVAITKDGLDATVNIGFTDADGKPGHHEALMSDLTCAYVGLVKIWPLMKDTKDTIAENQRVAALKAKEVERDAKYKLEQEERAKKLAAKLEERKAAKAAKEEAKAKRAAEIKAAAEKREQERKAKAEAAKAEKAKQAAEAKKAAEAQKKADTEKAAKAAEKLAKQGRLPK